MNVNDMDDYAYSSDPAYHFLAAHRKAIEFDPRFTDNVMVLDDFNQMLAKDDSKDVLYNLIEREYASTAPTYLPMNYRITMYEFSMAWVGIIREMVFVQDAIHSFCAEYGDRVMGMLENWSCFTKDSLVYRNAGGETPLHLAAKTWLHDGYVEGGAAEVGVRMVRVSNAYQEVAEVLLGKQGRHAIMEMPDFRGMTMKESIELFVLSVFEAN